MSINDYKKLKEQAENFNYLDFSSHYSYEIKGMGNNECQVNYTLPLIPNLMSDSLKKNLNNYVKELVTHMRKKTIKDCIENHEATLKKLREEKL